VTTTTAKEQAAAGAAERAQGFESGQSQMWPEPRGKKWKTKLLKNQRNVKVFKVNFSDGTCQRVGEKTESQSFQASIQIKGRRNGV